MLICIDLLTMTYLRLILVTILGLLNFVSIAQGDANTCIERFNEVKEKKILNKKDLPQHYNALDSIIKICKYDDSAYIDRVLHRAMALNDSIFNHTFCWSYYLLLYRAERYEDALVFANKLIEYAEKTKFPLSGDFYIEAGLNYSFKGDFANEIDLYHRGVEAYQRDQSENLTFGLSCLGNYYDELGDFNLALEYHNKALNSAELMKNKNHKYYNTCNKQLSIGVLYSVHDDYNTAKKHFEQALIDGYKQENIDLTISVYSAYIKYAITFHEINKASRLVEAANEFIERKENAPNFKKEYLNYYYLMRSVYGLKTNNQSLCIHPATLLKNDMSNAKRKDIFHYGVEYFSEKGDSDSALEYLKMELDLLNEEKDLQKKSATDLLLEKRKTAELAKENYTLKEKTRREKSLQNLLIGLLFILTLFFIVVYFSNLKTRELNNRIKENNNKITTQLKELERISYVMTHDLKEPANTILNFTELINKNSADELSPKTSTYFEIIQKSSSGMLNSISLLHNYLLVGATTNINELNLNLAVSQAQISLAGIIQKTQTTINCEVLPSIFCYPEEMTKLFQSLISNAIRYRHKDRNPIINIRYEENFQHHQIVVEDNGIGIAKESQEDIFELFKRLHTQSEIEGSGIGLANARKIVELHQGQIWVESKVNVGSKFYFTIYKDIHEQSS